jgi:DNA-binding beta-propeller fold protein YncE
VCIFVDDPGSDDIAAFNAGGFSNPIKLGNYTDPSGSGAYLGTTLAARGATLFAGYTASVNIGVWTINPDCSLTLASAASNTPTPAPVDELAVTPDGHTLVATYAQTTPGIGSFAISGSSLTPKGPYNTAGGTAGIDITKDSKYAIVGEFTTYSQVEVFPIDSDSSLGSSIVYSFPQGGSNSNNVALSPDETRLYVSNNNSFQITTLAFSEQALAGKQLQFFCVSNPLKAPPFGSLGYTSGLTTATTTGKGGYLYVVEEGFNSSFVVQSAVALLQIPADTCPAEVSGSPFLLPAGSAPDSVSAYPPRPF